MYFYDYPLFGHVQNKGFFGRAPKEGKHFCFLKNRKFMGEQKCFFVDSWVSSDDREGWRCWQRFFAPFFFVTLSLEEDVLLSFALLLGVWKRTLLVTEKAEMESEG